MAFLDTEHKRKSAIMTSIIMVLIIFLIFTLGLKYFDPPIEYGIAVNFGSSDVGSGNIQPTEPLQSAPQEVVEEAAQEQQEEVTEEIPAETVPAAPTEKVLTQDNAESIKIKQQEEARRKAEAAEKQKKLEAERIAREKREAEERKRAEEDAKKKKLDALMGGLSKSDGSGSGGEGPDNQAGDKGQLDGNPYANSYYGSGGGSGSGSGYGLNGRNLVQPGKGFEQDCNEYGRVVVMIEVDRTGKVVKATPGVKGSTNTATCLMEPARKTALSYKWNTDSKAPAKQIGFIVVNFNQ